ncbi:MAG: hypothetical protein WA584_18115 [Pyrinomonadaceae bacterium]
MNEWIFVIYGVAGLIFVLFALLFARRYIRKLFGYVTSTKAFGADVKSRLIGLGVAVILFPTVLPQIFRVFVSMLSTIIRDGSRMIFEDVSRSVSGCNETNTLECAGQITLGLLRSVSNVTGSALSSLYDIPVNRLILLLGVWALVAYLLDEAQTHSDNGKTNLRGRDWLKKLQENRNSVSVKNTIFFLILAAGAYLSMAAIAAIPQLQEKNVIFQEIGIEKLKLQLESVYSAFEKKYPSEIGNKETFTKLGDFLKTIEPSDDLDNNSFNLPNAGSTQSSSTASNTDSTTNVNKNANANANIVTNSNVNRNSNTNANVNVAGNTNSNTTAPAETNAKTDDKEIKPKLTQAATKIVLPRRIYDELNYIFANGKQEYERATQNYVNLEKNAKDTQKIAKDRALQSYETSNLIGKGNKERVKYFLEISDNYNQQANVLDQRLGECLASVQQMDNAWKTFTDTLSSLSGSQNSYDFISYQSDSLYRETSAAQNKCIAALPVVNSMPERPLLGEASELGIFGFVAGWLLKTESLPLALITGLIGFGLLGSACSTFIRERITQPGATPPSAPVITKPVGLLVSDLTAVIIRGLSAAIVVFLAVEGGLAIFAAGGGEPNPYVLLLTCLVAAVFSETIWSWAEKELIRRLDGEDDDDDEETAEKDEKECPEKVKADAEEKNKIFDAEKAHDDKDDDKNKDKKKKSK